jgi:hypothetical protein
MKRIFTLFFFSFLVTAIFSASLKVFFKDISWNEVLLKGLLIPCFTWTIQLILSALLLHSERRIIYWTQLGWVCLIGSFALMPAAAYNFLGAQPLVIISVINVLASVVLMTVALYFRLKQREFHWGWTASFVVLIVVNMSLYLYSVSTAI